MKERTAGIRYFICPKSHYRTPTPFLVLCGEGDIGMKIKVGQSVECQTTFCYRIWPNGCNSCTGKGTIFEVNREEFNNPMSMLGDGDGKVDAHITLHRKSWMKKKKR